MFVGTTVYTEVCQAQRRDSGHKELSVGTEACQRTQRCDSGHKEVTVGIKRCQWAQRRYSVHKEVSVGTETCQRASSSVTGHKGMSAGIKEKKGKPVRGKKSQKRAAGEKTFHIFSKLQIEGEPPSEGQNGSKQVFEGRGFLL